jgi:hypothetical protein
MIAMADRDLMMQLREDPERVFELSGQDLEGVVAELLASLGWEISGPSHGPDRGIDLIGISHDAAGFETSWAVEIKHYPRGRKVSEMAIRQVVGAAARLGLQRTMLVAPSGITRAAADAAIATGVFVADLKVVRDWLLGYEAIAGDALHRSGRQFRSCFVSYSDRDRVFAARLVRRLRSNGVRVWFAPEDLQPGQKINEEVGKAIETFDRVILVLSEASMKSRWVQSEVRRAIQRESEEGARVLFPLSIVPFGAVREWELFDSDLGSDLAATVREYFIPDFSTWEDEDRFDEQVLTLLEGLRAGS